MKFTILLEILFELLSKRKITARFLAEKFNISTRTVYRYVDTLSMSVPLYVKQGREGGVYLSDSYKLPKGFMTKEEYEAAIEALEAMYSQFPEERFLDAKRKLSTQVKAEIRELALSGDIGTILIDGGTWGDSRAFKEKLRLFEECIKERTILEIEYRSREGEKTFRKIEPHVLVFKQSVWYVYAFCHKQRDFRLFRLGRIFASVKTEDHFQKRPFSREDIPLNFRMMETETVEAHFEISEEAYAETQDWLGDENLREYNGKWYAIVNLPDDNGLVRKILGMGAGVKVLSPKTLQQRVLAAAERIAKIYN